MRGNSPLPWPWSPWQVAQGGTPCAGSPSSKIRFPPPPTLDYPARGDRFLRGEICRQALDLVVGQAAADTPHVFESLGVVAPVAPESV